MYDRDKKPDPFQQDEEGEDDESIEETKLGPPFGIVLNGHSLVCLHILPELHIHQQCSMQQQSIYSTHMILLLSTSRPQRHALKEQVKLDLLETAGRCQAVICCRVTPLQKVGCLLSHFPFPAPFSLLSSLPPTASLFTHPLPLLMAHMRVE